MLNQCNFIGNVGKAPEIRHTNAGKKVATFSIAVSEKWKDQSGERQERTEWIRCVCFQEGLCGVIESYINKGSKLYVSGKWQTRSYDKDGTTVYTTELVVQNIEMLDSPKGLDGGQSGYDSGSAAGGDFGDDIPFSPCIH